MQSAMSGNDDSHPCEVIDLASRRGPEPGVPEVPERVLADIDSAAMRCEQLRAEGREVRFDADPETGRVSAALWEVGGAVVRALPLRVVIGGDDGPLTAA